MNVHLNNACIEHGLVNPLNSGSIVCPRDALQGGKPESSDGFITTLLKVAAGFFRWLFCCSSYQSEEQELYPVTIDEGGISINHSTIEVNSFAEVASYLSVEDLRRVSHTCRAFHELVSSNELFVGYLMRKDWQVLILATPELMQRPNLQQLAFDGYRAAQLQHQGSNNRMPQWMRGEQLSCGDPTTLANLQQIPFFRKRRDKEVVIALVAQGYLAFRNVPEELRADREVVRAAVAQNGMVFLSISAELQADKEVVMAAVAQNSMALMDASKELRADREVVMAAVAQNGMALMYASAELKVDRGVVMAAVAQNGIVLRCVSEELQADREVVMAAVAQNGTALQYASKELQAEVVMAAVAQNGMALQYASGALQAEDGLAVMAMAAVVRMRQQS
ncbi:MAG: hypothetical protein K940chlam2_01652 [Chlamydiae bacterium]|nr:hypothetical protein [Chlamydiota bacterium]